VSKNSPALPVLSLSKESASFQPAAWLRNPRLKNLVNLVILSKNEPRDTKYERPATRYEINLRLNLFSLLSATRSTPYALRYFLGQTRRYSQPKSEKNKKIFTFLNSLLNNDLSSLTQYSSRFTRYEFGPNAQVRPFIERRCFSAPSDIVWDLGVLFWTFKFEKFEFI
jgi:hypothetical protein